MKFENRNNIENRNSNDQNKKHTLQHSVEAVFVTRSAGAPAAPALARRVGAFEV
jgi:hypothetical protein